MGEHVEKFRGPSRQAPRLDIPQPKTQSYEGVRGRADQADMELEMQTGRETNRIALRTADKRMALSEDFFQKRENIYFYGLYEQGRFTKDRAAWMKRVHQTRDDHRAATAVIVSSEENLRSPRVQQFFKRFGILSKRYANGTLKEQKIAMHEIKGMAGAKIDEPRLRALTLYYARNEEQAAFAEKAIKNEVFAKTFEAEALKTDDAEKAFAAALQASPELLALYKQQEDFWKSEHVADVFGPPQISGKKIEKAQPDEWRQVFDQVAEVGITLHVGEAGGTGELHFGDLVRQCAVYRVDGKPKFFIFDRNADRGIIGPFEPALIRTELAHLQIDEFFSQKFRKFSTTESEKDPTKVGDQKLVKIVRAFLPNRAENSSEHLSADERRLLTNLAQLFVTQDPAYPSLSSKIEFFERILAQPEKVTLASATLGESDFEKTRMTLKQLEGISLKWYNKRRKV